MGNQVATSGSTLDRQKSNSKDTDPTNLVDEGMRYYDLLTETFLTRDPAGMIDGPNEYTYVNQNPWTKFDPEGLNAADDLKAGFNTAADDFYQALAGVGNASAATLTGVNHLIYQTATDPGKTDAQVFGTFIHGDQTFFNISKAFNHVATEGTIEEKYEAVTYVAISTLGGGVETGGEGELLAPKPEPAEPPGAKPAIEQAPPQQAPPPKRCFPAGTQILLADGSTKSIDKIKVGDKVQCEDPTHSHKIEIKPVTGLHFNWTKRFIHIKVTDSHSDHPKPYSSKHPEKKQVAEILATGHHPIWTVNRGWVWAVNLHPGDRLLEANGNEAVVQSADSIPALSFTFNLSVKDAHSFFVVDGGLSVLVHNDTPDFNQYSTTPNSTTPIREGDIRRFGDFRNFTEDGLQGDELLQNSWLKRNSLLSFKPNNPSLALSDGLHDFVTTVQRESGLHGDNLLDTQSAYENIKTNIDVRLNAGIDRDTMAQMAKEAWKFAKTLPGATSLSPNSCP